MKVVIVLLALTAAALAMPQADYTSKYDNIDIDQILRTDRLLNNYVNCLLDKGTCTPDGKELKRILPDAIQSGCTKCNERQKQGSETVIRFLVNERPQTWEKLAAKFDPNNVYRVKFQNQAAARGIQV